MSRSNPNERAINPAKIFLTWDSDTKTFKYWNKELDNPEKPEKKGLNVHIKLPFQFLVLDTMHTITGFSDDRQGGIYSNEVKDLKKEAITIKIKGTTEITGLYDDIKNSVAGAKYAQSVYIGYFDENKELQIGNLKLSGASVGPWIEFCKTHKAEEGAIKVQSTKHGKKGKVEWDEPIFEAIIVSPETDSKAVELDKTLQDYLKVYFDAAQEAPVEDAAATVDAEAASAPATPPVEEDFGTAATVEAPEDDLPFNQG